MAKSPISRYDHWGVFFLLTIIFGGMLLPLLFLVMPLLGFVDISLLIFSVLGIIVIRRKTSILKRKYPEVFKAYNDEIKRTAEPIHVKLTLKDYPRWLIIAVIVSVFLLIMDLFLSYRFSLNPILEFSLMLPAIPLAQYWRFYRRKKRKQKRTNGS